MPHLCSTGNSRYPADAGRGHPKILAGVAHLVTANWNQWQLEGAEGLK